MASVGWRGACVRSSRGACQRERCSVRAAGAQWQARSGVCSCSRTGTAMGRARMAGTPRAWAPAAAVGRPGAMPMPMPGRRPALVRVSVFRHVSGSQVCTSSFSIFI